MSLNKKVVNETFFDIKNHYMVSGRADIIAVGITSVLKSMGFNIKVTHSFDDELDRNKFTFTQISLEN